MEGPIPPEVVGSILTIIIIVVTAIWLLWIVRAMENWLVVFIGFVWLAISAWNGWVAVFGGGLLTGVLYYFFRDKIRSFFMGWMAFLVGAIISCIPAALALAVLKTANLLVP